jgi:hypothetical protein
MPLPFKRRCKMTIEQMAIKVLSKLGNWDKSQPVSAEDLEAVNDAYLSVYAILFDDGLVTWANTEDIPDRFLSPLKLLITAELADDYQFPEPAAGWPRTKLEATNIIRRQLASGQPTEPVKAVYY